MSNSLLRFSAVAQNSTVLLACFYGVFSVWSFTLKSHVVLMSWLMSFLSRNRGMMKMELRREIWEQTNTF